MGSHSYPEFDTSKMVTMDKVTSLLALKTDVTITNNLVASVAGKASAVHQHGITDVTNLQSSLDGKAPYLHSHSVSDITGLNVSGDVDGKAKRFYLTTD